MVNPPIVEATFASGILLIATGFYGTKFLINHSGSDIAKLAIETNSHCLSLNVTSESYVNCTFTLEKLVKNLTDTGEIEVENCELDEKDGSIAYCPVWVWYVPQWLPLTDMKIVGVVGGRGSVRPSPKLEKLLSKLTDGSHQLNDLSDQDRNYLSQELTDLSDRGKDGQHSDELAQILSAILAASQDLTDQLGKNEISIQDDNTQSVLSPAYNLMDTTNGIIPRGIKQIVMEYILSTMQEPENKKGNMIENSLETIANILNSGDFHLMSNTQWLQNLLPILNLIDIKNILKEYNLEEKLQNNLNPEELEDYFNNLILGKSLNPNIVVENSFSMLNIIFQNLDTKGIVELLEKSGLIDAIVQYLETAYLDNAYKQSEIEKALAENLKTNNFFSKTLRSGIIEALVQNLHTNDDKSAVESVGLLLLLVSSLEVKGLEVPLDQTSLIKIFFQILGIGNMQDFLGESDAIGSISQHLESNFLGNTHHKSSLEKAMEENLKSNHYIDHTKQSALIKQLGETPEREESQTSTEESSLEDLSQDLELNYLSDSIISLDFLKYLAPSLDTNVLRKPSNKLSLMKVLFENIDIGDVNKFLINSGLLESVAHLNTNNEEGNTADKDQDMDHNIENSLISYFLKGFSPNPETTDMEGL